MATLIARKLTHFKVANGVYEQFDLTYNNTSLMYINQNEIVLCGMDNEIGTNWFFIPLCDLPPWSDTLEDDLKQNCYYHMVFKNDGEKSCWIKDLDGTCIEVDFEVTDLSKAMQDSAQYEMLENELHVLKIEKDDLQARFNACITDQRIIWMCLLIFMGGLILSTERNHSALGNAISENYCENNDRSAYSTKNVSSNLMEGHEDFEAKNNFIFMLITILVIISTTQCAKFHTTKLIKNDMQHLEEGSTINKPDVAEQDKNGENTENVRSFSEATPASQISLSDEFLYEATQMRERDKNERGDENGIRTEVKEMIQYEIRQLFCDDIYFMLDNFHSERVLSVVNHLENCILELQRSHIDLENRFIHMSEKFEKYRKNDENDELLKNTLLKIEKLIGKSQSRHHSVQSEESDSITYRI